MKPHVIRSTPGIIVALGIVLIVGGVFGIPFFGLGLIGITLGIVLLAVVRNERKVDLCGACKKVQGGER